MYIHDPAYTRTNLTKKKDTASRTHKRAINYKN